MSVASAETVPPRVSPQRALHIAARVGRLLLINGADTGSVQHGVDDTAAALGYRASALVTTEAILVTIERSGRFETRIGHEIPAMAVDMGRLGAIQHVRDRLRDGALDPDDADRALDAVETTGSGHAATLVAVGVAVTAASLARLFGGAWPVAAGAFLAGIVSVAMRRLLARRGMNPVAVSFLTAFVSGLCAAFATRLAPGASPVLCLTAAGMILVPGVPLINGVRDLTSGHAGNGLVRLTVGAMTVLAIGFALFLSAAVAGDPLPVGDAPGTLPVVEDLFFSALAAAGYAMLFEVPFKAVWACVLCGMASHGLRTALGDIGVDIASATLIGAFVAGLVARAASRIYRMPPVTFAFPGIVTMIPGSYGFRAGIGGLHVMVEGAGAPVAMIATTLSLVITTAVLTIAIGIGLTLALAFGARGKTSRAISTFHGDDHG